MSYLKYKLARNGDLMVKIHYYKCDGCGQEICESHPHTADNRQHWCLDCGFIRGEWSEKKYLAMRGICHDGFRAGVYDGKIYIALCKKLPWEKPDKRQRFTSVYTGWRQQVFERDSYTCQRCGKRGGELNAHHIKPYAKHKEKRFDPGNGITLCKSCHRKEHRKKAGDVSA